MDINNTLEYSSLKIKNYISKQKKGNSFITTELDLRTLLRDTELSKLGTIYTPYIVVDVYKTKLPIYGYVKFIPLSVLIEKSPRTLLHIKYDNAYGNTRVFVDHTDLPEELYKSYSVFLFAEECEVFSISVGETGYKNNKLYYEKLTDLKIPVSEAVKIDGLFSAEIMYKDKEWTHELF